MVELYSSEKKRFNFNGRETNIFVFSFLSIEISEFFNNKCYKIKKPRSKIENFFNTNIIFHHLVGSLKVCLYQ